MSEPIDELIRCDESSRCGSCPWDTGIPCGGAATVCEGNVIGAGRVHGQPSNAAVTRAAKAARAAYSDGPPKFDWDEIGGSHRSRWRDVARAVAGALGGDTGDAQ